MVKRVFSMPFLAMGVAALSHASTPLSAAALSSIVGGSAGCAAAAGLAIGLGISAIFGCGPCGVAAVVLDVGVFLAC